MTLTYILFALGFILLIKGADVLIDGSISIAKRLKISNLVIGLTIVSFGTSLPELLVNIYASIEENAGIAIGTVLGSNVANLLLVLGTSALFFPLLVQKKTAFRTIPFSLFVTILLWFFVNFLGIRGQEFSSGMSMISGFIFLVLQFGFMIVIMKTSAKDISEDNEGLRIFSYFKSTLYIIGGCIALTIGGKWTVDGAIEIANKFNVSHDLIGFTIIAVGTCLPELVTSVVAAIKQNPDIAVGNVVGSNIFNILWVMGLSAIINPLHFSPSNNIDILVVTSATILLLLLLFIRKKFTITWWKGLILILIYFAYIIYLIKKG